MALGPTQPPIQWVPGDLSLGVKRPGHETDHSPRSSAEVKNAWRYTSTPQYAFMAWCLAKHRDNFTFISDGFPNTRRDYQSHFISKINKRSFLTSWILECKGKDKVVSKVIRYEDVRRYWKYSFTPRPLYPRGRSPPLSARYWAGRALEAVWTW
jgi:hypothetical protein